MTKFYHKGLVFHLRYFRCATTRQSLVKRDCWSCSPPLIPSLPKPRRDLREPQETGDSYHSSLANKIWVSEQWSGLGSRALQSWVTNLFRTQAHPIPNQEFKARRLVMFFLFVCFLLKFVKHCYLFYEVIYLPVWVFWFWRRWSTLMFNNSLICIALFNTGNKVVCFTDYQDVV